MIDQENTVKSQVDNTAIMCQDPKMNDLTDEVLRGMLSMKLCNMQLT